jgi:hypothetical protein
MATALLIAALVLPVVSFWLLKSRFRLGSPVAAAVSIAAGWALNFAWACVAHESTAIAGRFGWACPAVLVAITWLVWRFKTQRAA